MLETISQVGIAFLGGVAMFLVARKNKWGFILGLASQPFWWYTTIAHHQWGIVAVNGLYTYSWIYGAVKWFKEDK